MQHDARLVYTSKAAADFTPEMLTTISEHARAANLKRAVTGLLLCGGGRFLQLLEGNAQEIEKLYREKIAVDARHTDCSMLLSEPCSYRLFPNWSMGQLFLTEADNTADASWTKICDEIAKEHPPRTLADDTAVKYISGFIEHFGDELDHTIMSAWVSSGSDRVNCS